MGSNNVFFLELLEWFDETGKEMVHRLPESGSGEIKWGAQCTVRDSQAAVFYYQGKAADALGPGRHTLKTHNLPVLNKILSIPWGMQSPLRAEVYFVNLKTFTDLRWGTRDPVAFKDQSLGLVRLRAFGMFNVRVVQPVLFVNTLVGTQGVYTATEIEEYLSKVVVSRLNDYLGENLTSILDLPALYTETAAGLKQMLKEDFSHFGLALTHLYINSITPPPEVQQAMDDKSKLALFDDMGKLMAMKAAMALEKAAENQGTAGNGMGLGMGLMMPGLFAQAAPLAAAQARGPATALPAAQACPDCGQPVQADARFCPHCGHQLVVFQKCPDCGKNLPPAARFCSRCGKGLDTPRAARFCPFCGVKNLDGATFCNGCGEKLELKD
jgi:membrane protease subunit (stomatin/prohibitin family)